MLRRWQEDVQELKLDGAGGAAVVGVPLLHQALDGSARHFNARRLYIEAHDGAPGPCLQHSKGKG